MAKETLPFPQYIGDETQRAARKALVTPVERPRYDRREYLNGRPKGPDLNPEMRTPARRSAGKTMMDALSALIRGCAVRNAKASLFAEAAKGTTTARCRLDAAG
jgi:hypothetical protein